MATSVLEQCGTNNEMAETVEIRKSPISILLHYIGNLRWYIALYNYDAP